jgi:hypothetical protein
LAPRERGRGLALARFGMYTCVCPRDGAGEAGRGVGDDRLLGGVCMAPVAYGPRRRRGRCGLLARGVGL